MKKCPQCNSVFDDSLAHCPNDATPLVDEFFVLPSEVSPAAEEEPITVVHHEPITIDIPSTSLPPAPTGQFNYQPPPPAETIVPVVIEKRRSTGKHLLFLVVGLALGGGLVLATVLFAVYLSQKDRPPASDATAPSSAPTAKNTPTATPLTASAKHEKRTDSSDDRFNGRVITLNAYVRSQPSRAAKEIDILPVDDRLEIKERAGDNSPWFRVACEHGTAGWMHGNTIEYTNGDAGF